METFPVEEAEEILLDEDFDDVVIFGKRENIRGDVCFARLYERICEMPCPEIHYVIREVKGVNYDIFLEQIANFFSCYSFSYERRTLTNETKCVFVEITPTRELSPSILFSSLNILFCTFRAVDYEFKCAFTDPNENLDAYGAVERYLLYRKGNTNHCLNEDLASLYDSNYLKLAIRTFFQTIKDCLDRDMNDLVDPHYEEIEYYEPRYTKGQTDCYNYLESLVDLYNRKGK